MGAEIVDGGGAALAPPAPQLNISCPLPGWSHFLPININAPAPGASPACVLQSLACGHSCPPGDAPCWRWQGWGVGKKHDSRARGATKGAHTAQGLWWGGLGGRGAPSTVAAGHGEGEGMGAVGQYPGAHVGHRRSGEWGAVPSTLGQVACAL